jgi:hypothetical protein
VAGSLNAFEPAFIRTKAEWASKLALVLLQGKIDPEIYYCHIDISVFGDPDSLNCQFTRGRLNLVSNQSNLGLLPEEDREIVPLVCEEIFKHVKK